MKKSQIDRRNRTRLALSGETIVHLTQLTAEELARVGGGLPHTDPRTACFWSPTQAGCIGG